jgi:hypothetical protein
MPNHITFPTLFLALFCFSSSVFAKIDFALTCVGNGQSLVLVAEHGVSTDRVLDDVTTDSVVATLTTTKPSFNRSELLLAKEDEKQFFYSELIDWAGLNYDKDIYYFLDRDTLKLTKYSAFPKSIGRAKVVAVYLCQRSSDPAVTHSQVRSLLAKKLEEQKIEKEKQLRKNKI